jgi:endonuclease-3
MLLNKKVGYFDVKCQTLQLNRTANKCCCPSSLQGEKMSKDARVVALLDFSSKIQPRELFPVTEKDAAAVVEENSFAFALAAVLDRGTKSEIIWTIPYDLQRKIGKLTPQFFVDKSIEELELLFRSLPNKPRYITDAPRTVKGLSQIVLREYGGNAVKIWEGQTSIHVKSVFRRIYGVGPGIASMIVLLLEKCFKIHFTDLDHRTMDVKPDVHIVRVFQRLGFINVSDSAEALEAARRLNPEYPGALDAPTWIIGKRWCSPFAPKCSVYAVRTVCPTNKRLNRF